MIPWIPFVAPLAVNLLGRLFPRLPRAVKPVLGPALGVVVDYAQAGGFGEHTVAAGLLGAAGTGIREIVKHWVPKGAAAH